MKIRSQISQSNSLRLLALSLAGASIALAATGTGCVNSRLNSLATQLVNNAVNATTGTTGPTGNSNIDSFAIGNVIIATPTTGGATAAPTTTIYFDPTHGHAANGATTAPIVSQHCSSSGGTASSGKDCLCRYIWSEVNSSTGSNQPFTRTVTQPVTNVQQQLVVCKAPDVYTNEIPNGTTIKVTVIPGPSNPDLGLFISSTFNYTKNTVTNVGSFQDAQGHSFDNIVHFSCYEQFMAGSVVQSKIGTVNNPATGQAVTYPIANQFCIQNPGGSASASPECPNPAPVVNSSQAYYYNFFVRKSQAGSVNQWNNRYTCPSIKEPIYGDTSVGSQGRLYPMDSNFALSMGSTPTFNIGVNAFVELSDGGADPISATAQLCDGTVPPGNAANDGFVQACLGYATKPNSDGSCPYIRDSAGAIRFTYRLRRLVALYPPLFGIDGKAPSTSQRSDTIYVLDRPVTPPTGSAPLKPYTMRGPKPCPFALFDAKGVLNYADPAYIANNQRLPIYGATNNANWNGTNVDGVSFPNFDSVNSCSTAMPLVKSDALNPDITTISIGTINRLNPLLQNIYIRPIHAWAPHYEEDTSFQACAPQASTPHDPPLHFSKDLTTGNIAWCAEVYPTQNDHVAALDQKFTPTAALSPTNTYIGHVRPFTSHIAKNSNSADCTATIPTTIPAAVAGGALYPAASTGSCSASASVVSSGVARHPSDAYVDIKNISNTLTPSNTAVCAPKTCDRTAIISGGPGWQQFPLLATAPQVEQAISSDTTYGCVMTYDGGGPKTGKTTPLGGCCGTNVKLFTGLLPAGGVANSPEYVNRNAHLEPDAPCLIPRY